MSATRVPPLPTLQELIKVYKLVAKKNLSQNFLFNQSTIKRLVRCAGDLTDHYVCEVGPGPGGITRQLLDQDIRELSVIEKDRRFLPILQSLSDAYRANSKTLRVFHGDVLKFNMADLFPAEQRRAWLEAPPRLSVIGNLPFNVSTPLIIRWLSLMSERQGVWRYGRTRLTLTFQKEIGERMTADVLHKQRSRLSIMCQYLCEVRLKHVISGRAFVPPPQVDVAVVHFTPRKTPLISQPFAIVEKVVRHTFHYRQKYCIRGVESLFPPELRHLADETLTLARIDPTTRPQQLSIEEFGRLAEIYAHHCRRYNGLFEYYYRDKFAGPVTAGQEPPYT